MNWMLKTLSLAIIFPLLAFAADETVIKTPEEIQAELDKAEADFKRAQEMFNPWYAGPLITGGAHNMPPGSALFAPFVSFSDNYAVWNGKRKLISVPDRYVLNPQLATFIFGITDFLDFTVVGQGIARWQQNKSSGGFGDLTLGIGIPILKEGLNRPAIRLVFNETFPTGRYQNLKPGLLALDISGSGSYQTQIGFRMSKLTFWSHKHPMNFRCAYSYTIPTDVHVHGFNAYGGGYDAAGTVTPGQSQQANAAFEYSFTQNWVFACDFVYNWTAKTTFRGNPGHLKDGTPSVVGDGYSDQLSLAPAIEYNPSANLNFVGGVWFDVYGRNTGKFVSGIVVANYTFKI